jgi:hypothetical protein
MDRLLAPGCPEPLPQISVRAEPAHEFNALFTRRSGWTGGDGTNSLALPDGRTLWTFADSFFGSVNPDGTRAPGTRLLRNAFLVQEGDALTTLQGGREDVQQAFVTAPDSATWYWPAGSVVEGAKVRVVLWRFERRGLAGSPFDFRWLDNGLATLSLPTLDLEGVSPAPWTPGILFGSALLSDGDYVYIYGAGQEDRSVYVARAKGGLDSTWEYHADGEWVLDPERAKPVLFGVNTLYSVVKLGRRYLLVTMDGRSPFSKKILAYQACSPTGPWENAIQLYTAPEAVLTYGATAHPRFGLAPLLVSYNVNAGDLPAHFRNADLYRPRFIWVYFDLSRP